MNPSLLADYRIVFLENPRGLADKLLELIRALIKWQDIK